MIREQGFFRARLTLQNDDFLEVAEFFQEFQGEVQTVESGVIERGHLRLTNGLADSPVVLVAIDHERRRDVGVPQGLGDDLGVDAVVQPCLGNGMAKRVQVVATGDAGFSRQPVHDLADAVRGQGLALGIQPQGVIAARSPLPHIGLDRLHAGFAQEDLAPSALAVYKHQSRTKLANPTLDKMGIDLRPPASPDQTTSCQSSRVRRAA